MDKVKPFDVVAESNRGGATCKSLQYHKSFLAHIQGIILYSAEIFYLFRTFFINFSLIFKDQKESTKMIANNIRDNTVIAIIICDNTVGL